ncbi:MAG: GNAT family N-acetyltransferase [Pyrinomonadaceae bacterium]|nr:GNAT family N-acetyltransferase [Pyrinomonadaceae bacterium]
MTENVCFQIKRLTSNEVFLAKELAKMFGFTEGSKNQFFASENYVRQMLEKEDFHVIVALENNKLIGGLTAYEMKMFKRETTEMFLYEIEVAENYRQKGVGKGLIEFLKEICTTKGIVEMFVGTEKDNFPAKKLYSATGGMADENSVWFNYEF